MSENSFTKKQSPKGSDRAVTEVSRYADVKGGEEKRARHHVSKGCGLGTCDRPRTDDTQVAWLNSVLELIVPNSFA